MRSSLRAMARDWRPAANRSTLDALVAMRVTSLRTGADEFIWSRPPYDRPRWTWARPGPEDWLADTPQICDDDKETILVSGVDVDLLADWCRALGAEATIIVPFDSMVEYKPASPYGKAATADELITAAAALVRYCNVTRKYGFKYWELGNESELNDMPSGLYVAQAKRFYASMKDVDPTIRIGVCADKQLENGFNHCLSRVLRPTTFSAFTNIRAGNGAPTTSIARALRT